MALTHELEHRACLQALADGWGVHPQQWTRAITMRGGPVSIPSANAPSCAEGAEQLAVEGWQHAGQRRAGARQPRGAFVAESESGVHARSRRSLGARAVQ